MPKDGEFLNEHHNYAFINDDTAEVTHRKGATPAEEGKLGIIPISSGFNGGVYLTKGLGNETYLSSASHGAGRRLGRGDAMRKLDIEAWKRLTKGVVMNHDPKNLDESPEAYKDGKTVIGYQEGVVVEVIDHMRPLLVAIG